MGDNRLCGFASTFFGVRRESASLVTPTMLSADFPSCGFIHKKSDGLAPRPPLSRSKCVKNSPALNSLTQLWESIGGLPFGAADLRQGVPVQLLLNVQPQSRGGVEQIIPSPFAHTLPPIHRHQGVLRAGTCHILLILPSFFSGCIHTEGGCVLRRMSQKGRLRLRLRLGGVANIWTTIFASPLRLKKKPVPVARCLHLRQPDRLRVP